MTKPLTFLAMLLAMAGCPASTPTENEADASADLADASDMQGSAEDQGARADIPTTDTNSMVPDGSDGERPAIRAIEARCPMEAPAAGAGWEGWANLQHPRIIEMEVGEVSEPVFGQVWEEGETDQPGQAVGWQGQLVVGPLGANPITQPGCFRSLEAEYNVDAGNNDEYWVRIAADRPGLYGMYFRFRPPGGEWRYGDLNGSDDGVSNPEAAILAVDDPAIRSDLRVVTLNLRCRTDGWDTRMPLALEALVAADPDVLGFQEDCASPGGDPQSFELLAALADRLDRGFEAFHLTTHQADHPEGTFDEGIAMLSSLPIDAHFPLDLPYANFPRVAQIMDVRLGSSELLRVVNTHLDFGAANDDVRTQSATLLVEQRNDGPIVVTGDFNAEPSSAAYAAMLMGFEDAWTIANPADAGYTMPADAPTRRIDYVWTSGVSVQSAVLVGSPAGQPQLSDHKGLSVALTR